MPITEEHVLQAVEILRKNAARRPSVAAAVDTLANFPVFEEWDEEELEALAEQALPRLACTHQPEAAPRHARQPAPPTRTFTGRISAPYRFVILPDEVAMPEKAALSDLDKPIPNGLSAEISVEWAAETPLLIGEEKNGVVMPMRLGQGGGYVIPGSSLRGMVRAAVEIVAHGRLGAANLHHRYGLRDFQHPAYKYHSPVSRVQEVKAGWLTLDQDKNWYIQPCAWAHVKIEDLMRSPLGRWGGANRESWIKKTLGDKYTSVDMKAGKLFDFSKTYGFSAMSMDQQCRKLVQPAGPNRGTLVFANKVAGNAGNKELEYVFFDDPGKHPVPLNAKSIETFNRLNCKPSKNKPIPDGSWKELAPTVSAHRRIPVFYVGDLERQDGNFAFGLTRLFKIPHERSVGDVLRATQANHMPQQARAKYPADFVENLFGYVVEADALGLDADDRIAPDAVARKGRVAFSFATLQPGQRTEVSSPVDTTMMAPRASFAPFYLKGAELDYSAQTPPRLAGRKRYLPRYEGANQQRALANIQAMAAANPGTQETQSHLRFLMPANAPDLRFDGRIRLRNVTAAELGAVLFALTHGGNLGGPFRHMIGRAKPMGAGQLRLSKLTVSAAPNDREAVTSDAEIAPYLEAFIQHMRTQPGLREFPAVPAIQEFLGASNPTSLPANMTYLPLAEFKTIRDAIKPQQKENAPPTPPAHLPGQRDGRVLPAPTQE